MKFKLALLAVVACCCISRASSQCLTLDVPVDNVVLRSSDNTVRLSGTALTTNAIRVITFTSGPVEQVVNVGAGGRWAVDLNLPQNVASRVTVEQLACDGGSLDLLVTPVMSDVLSKRSPAVFQVAWLSKAEEEVADIGVRTLKAAPNAASFVNGVKAETIRVAQEYLSDFSISVGSATADNVAIISGDVVKGYYGKTDPRPDGKPDCGDTAQDDSITIWAGSVDSDMRDRPTMWSLLAKTDTLEMRINDLGHIFGTLVAHEILHAAGLVGCTWMQGNSGSHNDPHFERGLHKRFDFGNNLMDPFESVDPSRLIGRKDTSSTPRSKLKNDAFSASYLRIIHPKP